MNSLNFEMVHKGLKPSRSARQLKDAIQQEFQMSNEQTNNLKFTQTGNQSNKFAFRPYGDSDQCDTHHSEEVITQLDECGATPSHYLNIKPVADIRQNSLDYDQKYQCEEFNGMDDQYTFNNMQTNSQYLEQSKKNTLNPLSRNNSTANNKDEITQFRGTDHCLMINNPNSRKNSLIAQSEEESYIRQKVLVNNKDLNNFEKLQNNNYADKNSKFFGYPIESNKVIQNKQNDEVQQVVETSFLKNDNFNFKLENNVNNMTNQTSQQKDSSYYDWIKEYQAANIPIPLQRVSSPQRHILHQDKSHFVNSVQQQNPYSKQNNQCESLKPEDLLMSQQEQIRFQEVYKQINYLKNQDETGESSQDVIINNLQSFQGAPIQLNSQQYQNIQPNHFNGTAPIISKECRESEIPPAQFNFNYTYSFSNNQFQNNNVPIVQQFPQKSDESGFNPEQQLNSISSSCILNIQSPKSDAIATKTIPKVLQKEQEKEDVQNHIQNLKQNVLKQKQIENKENKNIPKQSNLLKRNQSVNQLNSSPLNKNTRDLSINGAGSKISLHEGVDKQQINSGSKTPKNNKEQKRTITPQPNKKLERKMSDNLLLDKSKKRIESYEEQQLKECTFKPQISKQSQQIQRSFSQFIDNQNTYNKHKSDKIRMVQEQVQFADESQLKEKPDISKVSQKIIEQKRNHEQLNLFGIPQISEQQSVHNRLYSFHKKSDSNLSQNRKKIEEEVYKENTFKPQIHSKSKSIKREEKIEDLLYKDAIRRNNVQNSLLSQKQRSNSKYVSEKSEKILLKKFMKEMDFIINSLIINQQKNTANNASQPNSRVHLDMASLFEVMMKGGFVKYNISNSPDSLVLENEKKLIFLMWTLLGGKQFNFIYKENLFFFLLIILNLDKSFDAQERSIIFKELTYSLSHSSSQVPSPLASQASLKNFKKFETFTSIISGNLNVQDQTHSDPIQLLNKSSSSSTFQSPLAASNIHSQMNISLMKAYNDNFINIQLGSFDEKQQWIVNDDDKAVIRQAFDLFYRNRLSYEELKSQKNPANQQCSFHPNILENSKIMANQYREKLLVQTAALIENNDISYSVPKDGKIQHSDFLILQKRAQELNHKNKQEAEKQKELIDCSFIPSIQGKGKLNNDKSSQNLNGIKKSEELYQQSKNKENRPAKNVNEVEFEKQKNECTFQPELLENRFKKNYQGGMYAKNVNKTIERLRNARKDKEVVNMKQQRGYNTTNQKSSNSTAQIDQSSEIYQTTNTRKEDTQKNSSNNSYLYSNGGERITSYNSNLITNENQSLYQINTSMNRKNIEPLQNQKHQDQKNFDKQQNQLNQIQMQKIQYNNGLQNQQQNYSLSPSSIPQNHLLNGNMFSNQAIQQFSQRSQTNLQHSFAQQSPSYNYQANQYNNYMMQQENNIQNYIPNQNNNSSNQFNNNPLLEQNAPKFGNQQNYNNVQNSWVQNIDNNDNKPKSFEQYQESDSSAADSKDQTPLLFVDVNLGNQRNERIIINEGDNPQQLAYDFARLHGLDDQTAQKLHQLLENQIAGLLSRIEEEENVSNMENLD